MQKLLKSKNQILMHKYLNLNTKNIHEYQVCTFFRPSMYIVIIINFLAL